MAASSTSFSAGPAAAAAAASTSSFNLPKSYGNFSLSAGPVSLQESYNQPITVSKYTSDKTGLRVVLIDVEGPLCNLYASVATEIFNDSGCPHTLEHLVFLGSEKYPYKGVLDSLANRAFAQGTNAWTDTTNTTYTITTAGEEGFLRILPIYLDHVLYPTLTDAGFTTEVYSLNGKGEDAGVVYSEMQGRENLPFSVMALRQQRALYPEGSAYRSETGGLMDALRVLNIDQIRNYHGSYYLPHNLCLFATGKINPEKLLKVLQEEVEPSVIKHNQDKGRKPEGWKRPFVETPSKNPPHIAKDKTEVVAFPEKDESMGEVSLSWVGVPAGDYLTDKAIDILNAYLSDSAISPLQKALVEIDDPYATDLGFDTFDQYTTVINLNLQSVPSEKLESAAEEVKKVLRAVVDQGVDMERMHMVLHREQRRLLNTLEKDASDALTTALLSDFLFGSEDGKDLPESLDDMKRFKQLLSWSGQQWSDLLKKYYLEQSSLTVIGKPSAKLADRLEKETADRLDQTRAKLGEDGLKKIADKVKHAKEENDREIPSDMLSSFKIPDVNGIRWIDVKSASAGTNPAKFDNEIQQHISKDKVDLPYFLQFEHIQSNFVEISIYLNAAKLKAKTELLHLYLSSFHSLPLIRPDGTKVGYEDVVKLLDAETVDYNINFGSGISEQLEVHIKVEKDKYETAIRWLRDLLYSSEFDVSRLRIIAKKLVQNLPAEKREGSSVATSVFRQLTQDPAQSSAMAVNLLARLESSPALVERLASEPEAVVKDMAQLRDALTSPQGIRIAVAGDVLSLKNPLSAWQENFKPLQHTKLAPIVYGSQLLSDLGRSPAKKATIVPLASIESSFSCHIAKGPDSYTHPDLPALMVARAALNALEGLLWKSIRGAGLAYGANIISDVERGFTYFRVYRSPDCAQAYVAARKAMQSMMDGSYMPLDDLMIEAAKSELAFTTANQMSTLSDSAETSWISQVLKGVPQSYQRDLLAKAGNVTKDEVRAVVQKWLMPIFQSETSIAAVATSASKSADIQKQLEVIGFDVTILDISSGMDEGDESGSEGSTESWSEVEGSDIEMKAA